MLRLLPRSPKATNPGAAANEAVPLAILEFQSPTAAILAIPMPAVARYTGMWIGALVAIVIGLAAVMPVDEIISGTGVLASKAPTAAIQPFTASIVKEVDVHEGEIVRKGQILATLDPTYASADLTSLTAQQQAYAAQVAQLQAQEDNTPYEPDPTNPASPLQEATYNQQVAQYNFTVDDYDQKIKALQTSITGYNEQAAYFSQRLGIASNVETMRESLQKLEVGSKLDTLAATDNRVQMQASLSSAQSSAQQGERDLAAQEAERNTFIQQWRANISQQLTTAINNLTQAVQALAKAKLNDQLVVLTAPQDSVVQAVAGISPGSVLQSGATLMNLVPISAPLTVEADVSGEDSGYIHDGDSVNIKFDTLPFITYGESRGTVTNVSPDSFNPQDQSASAAGPPLPGAPQTLYYKIDVSLDIMNLHNVPKGFQIVPGMPLGVDVKVGKHSVLQFFATKIMPIAYDSMHEPQ